MTATFNSTVSLSRLPGSVAVAVWPGRGRVKHRRGVTLAAGLMPTRAS